MLNGSTNADGQLTACMDALLTLYVGRFQTEHLAFEPKPQDAQMEPQQVGMGCNLAQPSPFHRQATKMPQHVPVEPLSPLNMYFAMSNRHFAPLSPSRSVSGTPGAD